MVFEGMKNETALNPKWALQHSIQPSIVGSDAKLRYRFYVQVKLKLNNLSKSFGVLVSFYVLFSIRFQFVFNGMN
jgi:hypothetical protein